MKAWQFNFITYKVTELQHLLELLPKKELIFSREISGKWRRIIRTRARYIGWAGWAGETMSKTQTPDVRALKKSKMLSNWPKWLVVTQSVLFGSQDLEIHSDVSSFSDIMKLFWMDYLIYTAGHWLT